jgi:hypothetical protein
MSTRKFRAGTSSEDYDDGMFMLLKLSMLIYAHLTNLDSEVCTIDTFDASKDEFRAAPEGMITTPWPYDRSRASEEASEIAKNLEGICEKIL